MIRPMTIAELPKLIPGAHSFFEEAKLPGEFDARNCVATWTGLLTSGIGILGWESDAQGTALGAVGGVIFPDMFTGELRAMEAFWYVLPQHRGLGLKLFRWFERQAVARNARRIIMVHMESLNPDKLAVFYQRSGYVPLERSYIKEA